MTAIASRDRRAWHRAHLHRARPAAVGTLDLATQSADFQIGGPGFGDVLAAGDVTGDGLSDIVVGVPALNLVHLYAGQASGGILPTNPVTFTFATAADDRVGASIQLSDVDNDNIREILIEGATADGPGNSRPNVRVSSICCGIADPDLAQPRHA